MRVAIITENFLPKRDGVTRTIAKLLEHLQLRGHTAIVFAPDSAPAEYAGAPVIGVPGIPIPFYPELRFLFPSHEMERRLERFRPNVVHLADPMMLGMAGLSWAKRQAIPVVGAYHTNLATYMRHFHLGVLESTMWAYRRFLHNQCAVTLCPSQSTANALIQHGFKRVDLWPRGVDCALFDPAKRDMALRRGMGISDDTTLLLYTGRLSNEKNLHILAEAYRRIARPGLHLALVGDGPARGEMERDLAGLPVTFTGYLDGDALAAMFASSDLFTFPSTTETFGQVVQEAMASGLPVVACNAEGVRDVIQPGKTGVLAAPDDAAAFAAAIAQLLRDPDRRQAMAAAARAFAQTRLWSEVMDSLLATYTRIVAEPATPADPELDFSDILSEPQRV